MNQPIVPNMEEGLALMELAGRAVELYEKQPPEERRKLLNFVLSNSTWRDGNLQVTWRQPFDLLAESIHDVRQNNNPPDANPGGHSEWLPLLEVARTICLAPREEVRLRMAAVSSFTPAATP